MVARNYKVAASIGFGKTELRPVPTVLDTGCGPNLVSVSHLPENWRDYLLPRGEEPRLHSASHTPLVVLGRIRMTVQLGTFAIRTVFLVVRTLAVPLLLGTAYTNRYVKSIQCMDRVVHLLDGSSVAIQSAHGEGPNGAPPPPPRETRAPSNKVRVAHALRIESLCEAEVWVQTHVGGLSFLQSAAGPHLEKGILMANGVADPIPNKPFRVRVMNLSRVPRFLPKGMVLGYAMPHPTRIVTLVGEGDLQESAVVTVPDPPKDQAETSRGSPGDPDAKSEDVPPDWRDEVDLSHLEPSVRGKVLHMLSRHAGMWDGNLGTIRATRHRIDLKPGSRPVHSQPYRAGMRARQEEADEIDRMLGMGVIEPSCSEWASPIVLVPKSDGSLRFCVDYRRLNALTVRDSYPLPLRMDECIDSLGDAVVFSALDCNPIAPNESNPEGRNDQCAKYDLPNVELRWGADLVTCQRYIRSGRSE